jgi:hypothetical protein
MSGKGSHDDNLSKGIFEIRTAEQYLIKFIEDYKDFKINPESSRHAINAVMTGYHLHEWVWGNKVQNNLSLMRKFGLEVKEIDDFKSWIKEECPEFEIARKITNGSKHFDLLESGKHKGAFSQDFSADFDISYLYVYDEKGTELRADDIINKLIKFWDRVFKEILN